MQQSRRVVCSLGKSLLRSRHEGRHCQYQLASGSSRLSYQQEQLSGVVTIQHRGVFESISGYVKGKMTERQDRNKEKKMMEQLHKVSQLDQFTLHAFAEQIAATTDDWKTKIPGMQQMDQVKMAKETKRILGIMVNELGEGMTADQLDNLGRKEKLRVAVKADIPVSDINQMVEQFKHMDIMHSILKFRRRQGKELPASEKELRTIMVQDAPKVLSKEQKRDIGIRQAKAKMGHLMRKR